MHSLYSFISLDEILTKDGRSFFGCTPYEKKMNMIERYKKLLPENTSVNSSLLFRCIDAGHLAARSINERLHNERDTFTLDVGSSALQPFTDSYLSYFSGLLSEERVLSCLRDVQQDDHDLYLDYPLNVDSDSRLLLARIVLNNNFTHF